MNETTTEPDKNLIPINVRRRLRTLFDNAFEEGEDGAELRDKHLADQYIDEVIIIINNLLEQIQLSVPYPPRAESESEYWETYNNAVFATILRYQDKIREIKEKLNL